MPFQNLNRTYKQGLGHTEEKRKKKKEKENGLKLAISITPCTQCRWVETSHPFSIMYLLAVPCENDDESAILSLEQSYW